MNKRRFATAFVIMLTLLGVVHFVTYEAVVSIFLISNTQVVIVLRLIFTLLALSFIGSLLISRAYNSLATRIFTQVSSVWMGFILYLFLASALYGIIVGICNLFFPDSSTQIIGEILVAFAVLITLFGIYTANTIVITKVAVKLKNLPQAWENRKIVFISDVHLGQIHGVRFAEKVVRKIQELKPDMVLNGGDVFDGVAVNIEEIIAPFKKLTAPFGSFFVMGNHEEFADNFKYFSAIEDIGIRVLANEKVVVDGLQIIGVDYKLTNRQATFKNVLNDIHIDRAQPSLLLKHVPLNLEVAEKMGISLQLSGHTHRAQVFPFTLMTKSIYKGFDYGLKTFGSLQVLTTSGVGTWGPPMRVGTKSEIVLITFL